MREPGEFFQKLIEFSKDLEERANDQEADDGQAQELSCELSCFLVEFFDPCDVGDIRKMPAHLHSHAISFLIERDAEDEYGDITGYLDEIWEEGVCSRILEECRTTDSGLEICQWIDQSIPVPLEDLSVKGIVQ